MHEDDEQARELLCAPWKREQGQPRGWWARFWYWRLRCAYGDHWWEYGQIRFGVQGLIPWRHCAVCGKDQVEKLGWIPVYIGHAPLNPGRPLT